MFGDPGNSFKYQVKQMTDLCEIIDGDRGKNYPRDFSDEGYCLFLNAKNVTQKGFAFNENQFITKERDELLRKGKLIRGDIVLTTRGTIGNIAYYSNDVCYEHVRINSGMVIIRPDHTQIVDEFFVCQLRMLVDNIKSTLVSGSAQPQLPIRVMNNITMTVPPINKQRQYEEFVQQTDKSKFTEHFKSQFIEMFGTISETKYPVKKLANFAHIKHGFAFKGEFFTEADNGILLVTPGNFSIGGGFQYKKCKFFTGEYADDYVLHTGDLIVTMTDLSKESDTLGNAAIVPDDGYVYLHNQRIGLFDQLDEGIDKTYLEFYMRTDEYRKHILSGAAGSTVKHTSPTKILEAEFILPPLEKQKEFSIIKQQTDKSKYVAFQETKFIENSLKYTYNHYFRRKNYVH